MARTPARRRQRSVRVSVAVTLMALGSILVVAALPARSALWTGIAAVVALGLAWAALRMMWTEVLQSRRENARDRAAAATAYRTLFSKRAAEHAEFTTAMTERLAHAQLTVRELEATLVAERERTGVAESQVAQGERRLEAAKGELAELVAEHQSLQLAHADALTSLERVAAEKAAAELAELAEFEAAAHQHAEPATETRSA